MTTAQDLNSTNFPEAFAAMDAAAAQFWAYPSAEWQDDFLESWFAMHGGAA